MSDLTAVFYTCNEIPETFASKVREQLLKSIGDIPLISISHKPINFGTNYVVDLPRSHFSIYRQALLGAKAATTKYIACVEDDTAYAKEHFDHIPSPGKFAYNMSVWSLYSWSKPALFSYKDRRNLSGLICERDLFIEAMEERFSRWPDDSKTNKDIFGEPGKYERQLGVQVRLTEEFYSDVPNIMFSHETALSFQGLGKRKKLGHLRALEIPVWGRAETMMQWYR